VTIGKPIVNVTTMVVDDDLRVLPVGVPGKLCVAGVTLAQGYLGQPELTASRFLARTPECDQRVYLTGDLVRQTVAGELVFLGRADRQVKIRGFRIEPEEIEGILRTHARVADAVVSARRLPDGELVLIAYLQSASDAAELAEECRTLVLRHLPRYVLPSHFVVLERFPRTLSGKLDVTALPVPEAHAGTREGYVEPITPTEWQVADLMARAVHAARLGAADDFFRVGGHSLAAAHLVSRIREVFKVDVTIRDIFAYTTVAALAARIDELAQTGSRDALEDDVPLVRLPRKGDGLRGGASLEPGSA
jgi:hypothetical protein